MNGLDAWIEGDNVCSYCGMYSCVCEPDEPPEREEYDCMDCGMCDSCVARTKACYEEMEKERP